MKIGSKRKIFFTSVTLSFILSGILFLLTIKNNVKLFNPQFLSYISNMYANHLKKINFENLQNFKHFFNNDSIKEFDESIYKMFYEKLIPFKINFETREENLGFKINEDKFFSVEIFNKKNSNLTRYDQLIKIYNLLKKSHGIFKIKKNSNFFNDSLNSEDNIKFSAKFKKNFNKNNNASYILTDSTEKGIYEIRNQKINIFKHINFILLANKNENKENLLNNKDLIINTLKVLSEKHNYHSNKGRKINFYCKIAYLDSDQIIEDNNKLFEDLTKYNSRYLLDELFDDKYLNIMIFDTKANNNEYFKILENKDIKNHLFGLNFKDFFSKNKENKIDSQSILEYLILFKRILNHKDIETIANDLNFSDFLELIKLENSSTIKFYKMLGKIIFDLAKINKILSNYESCRNIEMIKKKFGLIENYLIEITKTDFNPTEENLQKIEKLFVTVKYLMESNEMVSYDHYFSFEFKIGTFVPVMIPIIYGIIKTIKGLSF